MVRRYVFFVSIALFTAAAAGCGGGGGSSDAVQGDRITIRGVDVPLSFEPEELSVDAGTYTVVFVNDGMLPHQLAIGEEGDARAGDVGDSAVVAGGGQRSFEVSLERGRYPFACYFDNHNLAGMVGAITVK